MRRTVITSVRVACSLREGRSTEEKNFYSNFFFTRILMCKNFTTLFILKLLRERKRSSDMHHAPVRFHRAQVNNNISKPKAVTMKSVKAPKIRPSSSIVLGHAKGSKNDMCPMQLTQRHPTAEAHTKPTKQKLTLTFCTYSDPVVIAPRPTTNCVEQGMEHMLTTLTLSS